MDAAEEEQDVQLQRASADLLTDFEHSLKPFLYRHTADGTARIRRKVRARETDRLVALLEPFQELPQLLDPHLGRLVPILADALLEYLRTPSISKKPTTTRALLIPLSRAICRLLYTFCKIRGEKVIVRFFGAETRHLELLLSAVEEAEVPAEQMDGVEAGSDKWSWEERYICLLWLSHLLLVPFDLASISSAGTAEAALPEIHGLDWPANLPGVALRVIPVAIKYLGSAGKERDAAKALLVRISMRRDMQELGLLHALVQWAILSLKSSTLMAANSSYYYIGILSYLAGILISSLSTADLDSYLLKIFRTVQNISEEDNVAFKTVHTSATARKTVIKVLRTIGVLVLRKEYMSKGNEIITNEIVETTIGHLLEALADNDTPVRLAASKALSVITLKLEPDMASQVVDAVLESLENNVLWENRSGRPDGPKTRDLSAVNPLEWHGLMLTLSHLLYRKSPPADSLGAILHSLLVGLSFERRSTSGSSIGTNVRDAACFGIWALARRYTTSELQNVETGTVFAAKLYDEHSSIIQVLATELVVSAALDSAGNIRRGASAALQELIGRHPDIVAEGIAVVQVVDYHAVALRSRAITEVAPAAARLSSFYEDALLRALLGWRGIGDGDASSRRIAASGVGTLARQFKPRDGQEPWQRSVDLVVEIEEQLRALKPREIDQRHGLILSMAAAVTALSEFRNVSDATEQPQDIVVESALTSVRKIILRTLLDAQATTTRRPEALCEASCRLVVAAAGILKAPQRLQESSARSDLDSEILAVSKDLLPKSLRLTDAEVLDAATAAALSLVLISSREQAEELIRQWITAVVEYTGSRARQPGYLFALSSVFSYAAEKDEICDLLLGQWQAAKDVESKVILLQCLNRGSMLGSHAVKFVGMIADGMDDYTTDARGDIGSLVRIEALRAAGAAFRTIPWGEIEAGRATSSAGQWYGDSSMFGMLYGKVLRLAAEKLDKVRTEAQQALASLIRDPEQRKRYISYLNTSQPYFRWLLDFQMPGTDHWLFLPLLGHDHRQWSSQLFEGYVSSADTGSEGLIRASRAALDDFCQPSPSDSGGANAEFVCATLAALMRQHLSNDRLLIPTMEAVAFLFDAGIVQRSSVAFRSLFVLTQKAHYKTGSVRKLEAAVKVYGGLLGVGGREETREVERKLTTMLTHPFPSVRCAVVDCLWVGRGVGKGVNWVRARKEDVEGLRGEMAKMS